MSIPTLSGDQWSEAYAKSPLPVREIIADENGVMAVVRTIVRTHNLHIDQGDRLQTLIGYALVGAISAHTFASSLVAELVVTEEVAQAITHSVNNEIFSPVHGVERASGAAITAPSFAPESSEEPLSNVAIGVMNVNLPGMAEGTLSQLHTPSSLARGNDNDGVDPYHEPIDDVVLLNKTVKP